MSKSTKVKARFQGKEEEFCRIKATRDGTHAVIPTPKTNTDGKHITVHPSGIINIRSKKMDNYDILSKMPELQTYLDEKLSRAVKIENGEAALIIDYAKFGGHVTVEDHTHTANLDAFLDECEQIPILKDNYEFISKYPSQTVSIVIIDKDGNGYWALKNQPGFGIPIDKID